MYLFITLTFLFFLINRFKVVVSYCSPIFFELEGNLSFLFYNENRFGDVILLN